MSYYERMPCRISDGPQTPEEQAEAEGRWQDMIDEDRAYEECRQIEAEAEAFAKGAGNK